MGNLKAWIREKLRPSNQTSQTLEGSSLSTLPRLPAERPGILTTSPSRDQLAPIDNYGDFSRLPPKIRRQILIEAFGNMILHMDLGLSTGPSNRPIPLAKTATAHRVFRAKRVDVDEPRDWQWQSCVCDRRPWWTGQKGVRRDTPFYDRCTPIPRDRPDWQKVTYAKYRIGVMGWLRACRQAYVEGIEVIFTTNTFHLSGPVVLENLSSLLLPQRIRNITALELIWDFDVPFQLIHSREPPEPLWTKPDACKSLPLPSLCRMIPETFPSLQHLYISLQRPIAPLDTFGSTPLQPRELEECLSRMKLVILGPVEDLVRALGPGRDINIAVQRGAWEKLMLEYVRLHGAGNVRMEANEDLNTRFWTSLDGDLGYWVCRGMEDMAYVPDYQITCL
ncbi:hypothetical protein GGR54DRAFT_626261 [Hypoxylon sp. NC1633]|nr:hypothetical protein GGR54DRAFT_626261 [Hypoxylon sp. NC1633]